MTGVKKNKNAKPTNADWNAWRAYGARLGMTEAQLDELYGVNYGQYNKLRVQRGNELAAWVRTLPKASEP